MTSPRRSKRASERGFTLLEVLVAFVIAALALGVMFDGILSGLRAGAVAGSTQEAVAIARSRLAAVSAAVATGNPVPESQRGDAGGGFHWSVTVRPGERATLAAGGPARPVTLYGIHVAVEWSADGSPRSVALDGARAAFGIVGGS